MVSVLPSRISSGRSTAPLCAVSVAWWDVSGTPAQDFPGKGAIHEPADKLKGWFQSFS